LNLFYEKVFAEVVFDHPELLSQLGLVEQFGFTNHNRKLDDEPPAHQQREFDNRFLNTATQRRGYRCATKMVASRAKKLYQYGFA
jgi:hypothetical protein